MSEYSSNITALTDSDLTAKSILNRIVSYNLSEEDIIELVKLLITRNKIDTSIELLKELIILYPRLSLYPLLLAELLSKINTENAIAILEKFTNIEKDDFNINYNLAVLYIKILNLEKAEYYSEQCLRLNSKDCSALILRAEILNKKEKFNEAFVWYLRALEISPEDDNLLYNAGVVAEKIREKQLAQKFYLKSLRRNIKNIDARWNLSLLQIYNNDLQEGYHNFQYRTLKKSYNFTEIPLPENRNLLAGKKILILWEQGLGDFLQMCRYLRLLKEYRAFIIIELKRELREFVLKENLADEICERGTLILPEHDYRIYSASLQNYFYDSKFPYPYLTNYHSIAKNSNKIKTGICWRGNPEHIRDKYRSVNIEDFENLIKLNNIDFFSLQYGNKTSDEIRVLEYHNIIDYSASFEKLTERIDMLDLIITVDTSLVHLAGGKGKKTIVLLEEMHDYRWGKFTVTDLYPDILIYRKYNENWDDLLNKIAKELEILTPANLDEWFFAKQKEAMLIKYAEECFKVKFTGTKVILPANYYEILLNNLKQGNYNDVLTFIAEMKIENELVLKIIAYLAIWVNNFVLAEQLIKILLKHNKGESDLYLKLALIFINYNRNQEALEIFEEGISNTNNTELMLNYGILLHKLNKYKEAEEIYRKVIIKSPFVIQAYEELGFIFINESRNEEALEFLNMGRLLGSVKSRLMLAEIYKQNEEYDKAEKELLDAIAIDSTYYEAHLNIANLYFLTGRVYLALKQYSKMMSLFSINSEIKNNILICFSEMNLFDLSIKHINDTEINEYVKSEILLTLRNFSEGLIRYERREAIDISKRINCFDDLIQVKNKNVLILFEQSFGDMIFFLRYCKELKKYGAKIFIETKPEIDKLFSVQNYIDFTVSTSTWNEADYILYAGSLCKYFLKEKSDIDKSSYIQMDNQNFTLNMNVGSGKFKKVGVCWRGNKIPVHNRKRHLSIEEFLPILKLPYFQFYSLQYAVTEKEKELLVIHNVIDTSDSINDFYDTARIIQNLDLIITIDTAIAHLAGAMGKDVLLLLPYAADWRWGVNDSSAVWYKNMKIFRQIMPGDWFIPVNNLIFELSGKETPLPELNQLNKFYQLIRQSNYCEAEKYFYESYIYNSIDSKLILLMAFIYTKLEQPERSIALMNRHPSLFNNNEAKINIANMLFEAELTEAAMHYYRVALDGNSKNPESWYNFALALYEDGNLSDADKAIEEAININPEYKEAIFNKGIFELTKGNLIDGLKAYELRYELFPDTHRKTVKRWNKENLEGKRIYVYNDQGFGDFIQQSRNLPLLKQKGAFVILEVKEELWRLTSYLTGYDQLVLQNSDKSIKIEYDFCIEMSSIQNTLEYYEIEKINSGFSTIKKLEKKNEKLNIGIFWRGSTTNYKLNYRSCDPNIFLENLKIEGIELVSLQKNNLLPEDEEAMYKYGVNDYSIFINDFLDTAEIINGLDLIITIDSVIAHLAGSLNKETWVLLPYVPDWRWGLNNEHTDLYNNMKLFRQSKKNDWKDILKKVRFSLQEFVKNRFKNEKSND